MELAGDDSSVADPPAVDGTNHALELRWAADLIGLAVIWFLLAPATLGAVAFSLGDFLGVLAVRVSLALGFTALALAGVLLARSIRRDHDEPWPLSRMALAAVVLVAGLGALLALVTPFVMIALSGAMPVAVILLSLVLATRPTAIAGTRPRTWWRLALVAQLTAVVGTLTVASDASAFGFRPVEVAWTTFSFNWNGQRWNTHGFPSTLVAGGLMALALAAILLELTAATLTRGWAQAQLEAARPIDPGSRAGVTSGSGSPLPPPPATTLPPPPASEEPPWDPDRVEAAWATVDPRPDDDLLRP